MRDNGFWYNEKCYIDVKAEYLKKPIRARVRGELFGIFNSQEYEPLQEVEKFIEDDGIARMKLKHLWYIDDHYFK
ncbi:hypothetical protein CHISP_2665 [Chitinispirillum alkaliphilum]|nr:hypothetical protein CHISP_2665 [Chitinispirillum alkaliphilum]